MLCMSLRSWKMVVMSVVWGWMVSAALLKADRIISRLPDARTPNWCQVLVTPRFLGSTRAEDGDNMRGIWENVASSAGCVLGHPDHPRASSKVFVALCAVHVMHRVRDDVGLEERCEGRPSPSTQAVVVESKEPVRTSDGRVRRHRVVYRRNARASHSCGILAWFGRTCGCDALEWSG